MKRRGKILAGGARVLAALACLVLIPVGALAQVPNAPAAGFVIESASFKSEGRTRPYFLERAAGIEVGRSFADRASLEAYVADRRQVLLNERVLESVEIEVVESAPGEGGVVPVALTVRTVDTWNIVALPYFRYDSNTGTLLSARARDYDFLGTMEPLRVNFDYTVDTGGNVAWGGDFDFSVPFEGFGRDWTWSMDGAVSIPEDGIPDLSLSTGLGIELPTPIGLAGFSASQGVRANGRDSSGTLYDDRLYLTETVAASLSVALVELPTLGLVSWVPGASFAARWDSDGLSEDALKGPAATFSQSVAAGRVDWIDNFRRGFAVSVDNSNSWNFHTAAWSRSLSFSAIAHRDAPWFGASGRLSGFLDFDGPDTSAGDPIRGVLNDRIDADAALFLNLDLPVRVIHFAPAEWFGVSWMRFFHFEQHWSPFLDVAFAVLDGTPLSADSFWYGGGLELVTFPKIMRSFYVRISVGFDLATVAATGSLTEPSPRDGRSPYELFFGLGHHY